VLLAVGLLTFLRNRVLERHADAGHWQAHPGTNRSPYLDAEDAPYEAPYPDEERSSYPGPDAPPYPSRDDSTGPSGTSVIG
jgi:hypothetical protein